MARPSKSFAALRPDVAMITLLQEIRDLLQRLVAIQEIVETDISQEKQNQLSFYKRVEDAEARARALRDAGL